MPPRRVAVVLVMVLLPACVHVRRPLPAPPPAVPMQSPDPLPDGRGRVYLDVLDGPTEIGWAGDGDLPVEPLCTTPCVADLPLGRNVLTLPVLGAPDRVSIDEVIASTRPVVYRRVLSSVDEPGAGLVLGIIGTSFGGMSLAVGASLLPIGLAEDMDGMTLAGEITLGVGAVLTAVSILAIVRNPTVEQPGAGAQYDLPQGAP